MTRRGVFISYRRADKAGTAHRLRDHLLAIAPRLPVAMDAYDIPPGSNFETRIADLIRSSAVLLVVIGPHWATMTDAGGKSRLDEPLDLVRREIELAAKSNCTVVPVLVDGARMPSRDELSLELHALLMGQAVELRNEIFADDVGRLLEMAELSKFKQRSKRRWLIPIAIGTAAIAISGALVVIATHPPAPASMMPSTPTAAQAGGQPAISIKAGRDVHIRDIISGDKVQTDKR